MSDKSIKNLKHGLTSSRMFVLANETPEKWIEMRATWMAELQPRSDAERQIVTDVAHARWRLQRVWTIENAILDAQMDAEAEALAKQTIDIDEGMRQASAFKHLSDTSRSLEAVHRYETRYRRAFERGLATLERLRNRKLPESVPANEGIG